MNLISILWALLVVCVGVITGLSVVLIGFHNELDKARQHEANLVTIHLDELNKRKALERDFHTVRAELSFVIAQHKQQIQDLRTEIQVLRDLQPEPQMWALDYEDFRSDS